ncbi:MAG: hypothetical protein ACOYOJ_00630 [Alsobacter sp.]
MPLRHWTVLAIGSFWALFFLACTLRHLLPPLRALTPGDRVSDIVVRALSRTGHAIPTWTDPGSVLATILFLMFAVLVFRIVDFETADGGSALGIGLIVATAAFIGLGLLDRTPAGGSLVAHPFAGVLACLIGSFAVTIGCGSLGPPPEPDEAALLRERLVQDLLVKQYGGQWKTSSPTSPASRSAMHRTLSPPPG